MEGVMSTMTLTAVTFGSPRSSILHELKRHVAQLRARARSRHELMMLSDHDLADMGLTRMDAEHEGDKPFWRV
jgi:uncharacterized protein YjiS (DUF1127 family)